MAIPEKGHLAFKLIAGLVLAAGGLSATTPTIQVQSLTGGFLPGMVGGNNLFLYCVDFENSFYTPSQIYTANITPIGNGSDLSNTIYGRAQSAWAPEVAPI